MTGTYVTGKRRGVVDGVKFSTTGSGTRFVEILYYCVGLLFSLVMGGEAPAEVLWSVSTDDSTLSQQL